MKPTGLWPHITLFAEALVSISAILEMVKAVFHA